jgi:hypothetical protein
MTSELGRLSREVYEFSRKASSRAMSTSVAFATPNRTYQYRTLQSSRHIRLLKLRGHLVDGGIEPHELVSIHLDHAPAYIALSYRWDAENGFGLVSIGNKLLKVTLACKAAMIHFSKMTPGTFIWIDAVCINQTDVKEKNEQIALMRSIYQTAYSTAIWLGEALPDLDFECNLHAALKTGVFDMNNMELAKREDPNHPLHPRRALDNDLKRPYHEDWKNVPSTLELVLQRSWFGRVWMIQEAALSQRLFVCCANALLEWDQVVEATRRLAAAQGPNRKALFDLPLRIMDARDQYQRGSFSFCQILQLSRSFEASDPRDKIYGMLGLSEEFANAIGPPDYHNSAAAVWSKMACVYLSKYSLRGLSMLASAIDLENMQEPLPEYMDAEHRDEPIPSWLEGLNRVSVPKKSNGFTALHHEPSWVPNLNFPALEWPMNEKIDDAEHFPQTGELELRVDGEKLHVQGAFLSTITIVPYGNTSGNNRQMWWAWDKWMEVAGWLDMTQRSARHPEHPHDQFKYFTGESMRLVFWKTIFCDMKNEIENDESLHWWHDWFCCELWMNLLMLDSRFLLGRDADEQELGRRTTSVALVRNATRHKKFFQAEDVVGIGPLGIQEGDKIIMLHGYRYPFVVRPKLQSQRWIIPWRKEKTEYELIGPCYIHAVWEWDEYHDKKLEWEHLTIG